MKFIAEACKSSRDLALLLKSPIIKTDKKQAILKMACISTEPGILACAISYILGTKKLFSDRQWITGEEAVSI
jgi:F0F1-type ATP synthase delta subunit